MITLDLSILNQKGTPMFYSDLTANRPIAGIAGRIFIATDSPYGIFRDTGSAWEQVAGAGGGGGISGSGSATQVAFWTSASAISGSNNLFWDSTNNYLGIGTNTPTTALDVHHSTDSGAIFNQTTGTNNNTINFQTSGSGRWRIGNFYTAGADDFAIFDVVGSLQQLTIVKTTGQTFIGAKTTASGRLVVNSATADNHLQIVGANSPSIRIDNAGSGGTQRFAIGNATATNNFIQGSAAGQFCITTASSGAMLFGMWQTIDATEVMRITTARNLLIGGTIDAGFKADITGTARVSGTFTSTNGVFDTPSNLLFTIAGARNVQIGIFSGDVFTGQRNIAIGSNVITPANNNSITIGSNSTNNGGYIFGQTCQVSNGGMALGRNATSSFISSVAIGTEFGANATAVSQFIVESVNWHLGNVLSSNPTTNAVSLNAQSGSGTNINANTFTINGGRGTGTGTSGDVILATATPTTSGTTLQSLTARWYVKGSTGILSNVLSPNSSAQFQIDSITRGFLPPRMTNAQRTAIVSPAVGLIVYCTDAVEGLYVNKSTGWTFII